VANQLRLRRVVGVGIGAFEAQCVIPRIRGTSITRTQNHDLSLSSGSSIFGSLVGTTNVGQLVVNSVGDDSGVESFLLPLIDKRVDGLESRFGGCTTVKTSLELDGRGTDSKVEISDGGSLKAGEVSSYCVGDCSSSGGWSTADQSTSTSCACSGSSC
jgi:hypothetical protein